MDPNDSSILNEEFTLNTNDIHPPLEVWEQFFTKNNLDLDKIILYENFYKNISTKKTHTHKHKHYQIQTCFLRYRGNITSTSFLC